MIYISQQNIISTLPKSVFDLRFNKEIIDQICLALMNKVYVFIMVSSILTDLQSQKEECPLHSLYWSPWSKELMEIEFGRRLKLLGDNDTVEHLKYLHITHATNTVDNKCIHIANHGKVVIVDGNISYVGSHNLYDGGNIELGLIFDSGPSRKLLTDYFAPLWH